MPTDGPSDELLRNLLAAMDLPEVDLIEMGERMWSLHALDDELAALEDVRVLTEVRTTRTTRVYSFVRGPIAFDASYADETGELTVDTGGSWATGVRLLQLTAPDRDAVPDVSGVCKFSDVAPGAAQLEITTRDGASFKTQQFHLP